MKKQEIYTREETATMLDVSLTTLHTWTTDGIIVAHYLKRRVYYLRKNIFKALKTMKQLREQKE